MNCHLFEWLKELKQYPSKTVSLSHTEFTSLTQLFNICKKYKNYRMTAQNTDILV